MATYSKDFKRDALKYVEEHPEMKMKDVADRLGIPLGTLYDWNKKRSRYDILGEEAPPSGPLTEEEKEIRRLQRENRDLEDALTILKKAIGILGD